LREMRRVLVDGTRQKAHVPVQARLATSLSPDGPIDEYRTLPPLSYEYSI